MSNTERNIRVDDGQWSAALAKAAAEDRSVADVFRELVGDWLTETIEEAEARAKAREMEAENARLKTEVSGYKKTLREWLGTGQKLEAELNSLSASLPDD